MQNNSKILDFKPNVGLWILKNILFAAILYSVYLLLKEKGESISDMMKYLRQIPVNALLITVLLLIPANWAFEAWKWQRLAIKVESLSFWEAYKGVLAGLALGNFTPFMLGDYAGKIAMLKTQKRKVSIGAILLGNGMQLYVSLLFGGISYLYFLIVAKPSPFLLHIYIVAFLCVLLLLGIWIAFNLQRLNFEGANNRFIKYIGQYLSILKEYSQPEIRDIFLIASGRYLIFAIQFLLVLQLFQINLSIPVLLSGIGLIFLTKTLGAAFNFLGDLSIRAVTSIYYFGYFGVNLSLITTAAFTIWFINVLVPVMVGSVFILSLRFSAKQAEASA